MLRRLLLERVDGIVERARADRRYLEAIQRHAEGNVPGMRHAVRLFLDLLLAVFVIMYIVLRLVSRNAAACAVLAMAAAIYYLFLCLFYYE
ncbi:hypothetical protein SB87_gp046 [Parapoxvirus red deer/HL953]|uniref:Crescent membrane and immature virion formation protein n=1 Tax=Parapoxvirus red deer/HL953 TaxID=1579460 RepID=A0A0A7M9Y2_9POXV|nr:hypothetical protein SB87_gp046 [Parapoxvirus red deer/HL953]AIZ77299.1 hypothetical protein [Parapoxvirus red deer/HL953]